MKEPVRNFKCPECSKLVVNAHALKIHRAFKHAVAPAPTAPAAPKPTPAPTPAASQPVTKKDDWWD